MNEEHRLRASFSRLVDGRPGPTRRCPGAESIAAYVDGRLDRPLAHALEDHLADCSYCLEQVSFLARAARLSSSPPVPVRLIEAVSEARSWVPAAIRRPALSWLAAAAGVVLLVLTVRTATFEAKPPSPQPTGEVTQPLTAPAPPPIAERSVRGRGVSARGPIVLLPRAGERIDREDLAVVWEPVSGVLDYSVQLMSARGELLWDHGTEATRASVPMDVVLDPAERYFVRVTARLSSGEQLRSRAVEFELEPEADP